MITKNDREYIIKCLQEGLEIPSEYKYSLFPTQQKEYELVYAGKMRKEDILSDTDEISNVPLQVERTINENVLLNTDPAWRNLIIFGDNLQVLKSLYYNSDVLIKNKVKGKIKLIYIDPPFATEKEFKGNMGQRAYIDKVRGAEFVEFLRRRLVLMHELLSDVGFICVHLDYRKKHYIKIVMDEIFGESNFRNEIAVSRVKKSIRERKLVKKLNEEFDTILLYSKSDLAQLLPPTKSVIKKDRWHAFDAPEFRTGMDYILFGHKPAPNRHWSWEESRARNAVQNYEAYEENRLINETLSAYCERLNQKLEFLRAKPSTGKPEYFIPASDTSLCNNLWTDLSGYSFSNNYPTEKNEFLLRRIIEMTTTENDIVLDCFAGSGTTLATSEKMNRRWVGCDIGKLSLYTIQKRLIDISNSKDLLSTGKKYGKPSHAFSIVSAGLYDLGKVFSLSEDRYKTFVKNLFDIDDIKKSTINGITIDGEKRGYFVKIYPYWDTNLRDADVDEEYVEELHKHIGGKVKERFYIVAPANNVAFINDYYEIDGIKYYFLKIPYQVIHELHNSNFKKIKQPQSANGINDLEEAVGFHFKRQPDVVSELIMIGDSPYIKITKFMSDYSFDEDGIELHNFESLSMILIDANSPTEDDQFKMTNHYFAEDLIKRSSSDETETDIIRKELTEINHILVPISRNNFIRVIYIDIYGNEFIESFKLGE